VSRLIQWFTENSIAANLLMLSIIIGALFSLKTINKEVFPTREQNFIEINMAYPGAGPSEVEQQVTIRIEESIADVSGIYQIKSSSNQGYGSVNAEIIEGYDPEKVLNQIKARIDAIITFPGNAERATVKRRLRRIELMFLVIYGDVDELALKEHAQQVRDDISLLDGIALVEIRGMRADEVSVEISEYSMRRYNLTFDQVAKAIRESSLNLPAGLIKSQFGDIQVQSRSQAYTADDFADIVIVSRADGSQLLLADIASINDGFSEQNVDMRFDDKPALYIRAYLGDNPDVIQTSQEVRDYIKQASELLPPGMEVAITYEMKELFDSRLGLLLDNTVSGLLLVFIVLMLFLRPALAVWVCVGISTAFCGALWFLPYFGVSINMISMFAFLMVLGIVVDDAIIVGESIYSCQQDGLNGNAAAAGGAKRVALPVFFAVISTMIFFLPFLDAPPAMIAMTKPMSMVVILCLLFSLIESMFILPAHLANLKPERESQYLPLRKLAQIRAKFAGGLTHIGDNYYQPVLSKMLNNCVATASAFLIAFLLSIAVVAGSWFTSSFLPNVPSDAVIVNITMPEGSPFHETRAIAQRVSEAAEIIRIDPQMLALNDDQPFITEVSQSATDNTIFVFVGMEGGDKRLVSPKQLAARMRELIGPLPTAKTYSLDWNIARADADIRFNLSVLANDLVSQRTAVDNVTQALASYPGVFNVRSSLDTARTEVELSAKAYANTLGISQRDIAAQVRQGFYGEEVQRIPRAREDVKVMLRYPVAERSSLDQLGDMRIRSKDGVEIPLTNVAEIDMVPAFTSIQRIDRKRNISITAELDEGFDATQTIVALKAANNADWQRQFAGFSLQVDGNMKSQSEFGASMLKGFIMSLFVIYALMAIAFRSYAQPLLILTAIPFGFMGAIIGHLIMGEHNISMLSILGFLACAGVVVNDNLVLLDRINQLRAQGKTALEAVTNAGRDRFRAIILTSLTTFIGLMPILFETSLQAQFLIPMVISLSFGVLFATSVTLILVPSLYLLGTKIGARIVWRKTVPDKSVIDG
jgi:multidrug efflux pump subunit AcrB